MNEIYKRSVINNIEKWLDRPEIIVITGSRQVGKTFLTRKILPTITKRPIKYFNFEDLELRSLFQENPKGFMVNIENGENIYVFDEFQKVPKLTSFLKVLYDQDKDHMPKIFLTGSSSLEIQKKISQSLVGQSIAFNLFSLSFLEKYFLETTDFLGEILSFQKVLDIEKMQQEIFFEKSDLTRKFDEYILQGGYPELGELADEQTWQKLKSIAELILEKDLRGLVKDEHLFSAKKLLEILAYRIGNIISFENLAAEMQLNIRTVRNLIAILEGLFFIELVYPKANFAHEYKKAPKVYFNDLGMRNEMIRMHKLPVDRSQLGAVVENFIFAQLKRYSAYKKNIKINYWQNYNKNEVDFILDIEGKIVSVEVKYQKSQKDRLTAGVLNFIKKYHSEAHITVTFDYFGISKMEGCTVYFIPAYMFGFIV
ncbi:MAG: AAA ATPase [Candidatus Moranbacteria bacterium GW2011_GWE1_35_17]|nr:MAG: AAA ATPase [Candidatus Moranbacteria bacterium GW2011_GWE1_35_17]KKP81277.1 MAG: AAA ATPase [Candidatus Moranbacteria bacterium GW2011_GWF1_35_5]KKP82123.1 MAG: AAA ATPase [Candidatus Moranbacteria bacterium GW2011_GWF2_35_54]